MNSPPPPNACAQAGTSAVVGTVNEPPGPVTVGGVEVEVEVEVELELVDREAERGDFPEHAAKLNTVSAAATPPAPRRKVRRSMAARCAAHSISASVASKMSRSWADGLAGTNSPFVTGPAPNGSTRSKLLPG